MRSGTPVSIWTNPGRSRRTAFSKGDCGTVIELFLGRHGDLAQATSNS